LPSSLAVYICSYSDTTFIVIPLFEQRIHLDAGSEKVCRYYLAILFRAQEHLQHILHNVYIIITDTCLSQITFRICFSNARNTRLSHKKVNFSNGIYTSSHKNCAYTNLIPRSEKKNELSSSVQANDSYSEEFYMEKKKYLYLPYLVSIIRPTVNQTLNYARRINTCCELTLKS
jgi:hypothetical protein